MQDETERAIDGILDGRPRAEELEEMITALKVRRDTFMRERDAASPAQRASWEARVRAVERQIKVLHEERAITEFVENSVRVTVNRHHQDEME